MPEDEASSAILNTSLLIPCSHSTPIIQRTQRVHRQPPHKGPIDKMSRGHFVDHLGMGTCSSAGWGVGVVVLFYFFPQLDLGDDSWRFIPGCAVSHFSPSRGQQQLPALEPSLHLSFTACPQQSCSVRAWQGATQPQSRRGGSHPVRSAFPDDSTRHPSSLPRTVFCLLTFHFQAGPVSLFSLSPPHRLGRLSAAQGCSW